MLAALCLVVLPSPQAHPTQALRGLDPVRLCEGREVPGREDQEEVRGRYVYLFEDAESRARFRADPERWGIQWGGGCARMGPLSGVGSPERWVVHSGRIYLFASDGCRDGFLAAPERFVVETPELPQPSDGDREAGAAWIARAVEAHGGPAAIDGPRALRLAFEGPRSGWNHRLEHVIARDGEFLRRSTWVPPDPGEPTLETVWRLAAESFVDEGDGVFPLTSPDQLDDLRRFAHREPLTLLWAREDERSQVLHLGAGELGGEAVEDVLVHDGRLATVLHLDPESGRIRGLSWRGRTNGGTTHDVVETFTAWREVDGVLLPTARAVAVDGRLDASLAVAWDTVERLAEASAHSSTGGSK